MSEWRTRVTRVRDAEEYDEHGYVTLRFQVEVRTGHGVEPGPGDLGALDVDSELISGLAQWMFGLPNIDGTDAEQARKNYLQLSEADQIRFMVRVNEALAAASRCIQADHDGAVHALRTYNKLMLRARTSLSPESAQRFLDGRMTHEQERALGLRWRRTRMAICPECAANKHPNCAQVALDEDTDDIVECACTHPSHSVN